MSIAVTHINDLILEQLAQREMRLLSLVVAIRKGFVGGDGFKGDLTNSVKAALRKLIASRQVMDVEGMYTLIAAPAQASAGAKPAGRLNHA